MAAWLWLHRRSYLSETSLGTNSTHSLLWTCLLTTAVLDQPQEPNTSRQENLPLPSRRGASKETGRCTASTKMQLKDTEALTKASTSKPFSPSPNSLPARSGGRERDTSPFSVYLNVDDERNYFLEQSWRCNSPRLQNILQRHSEQNTGIKQKCRPQQQNRLPERNTHIYTQLI